MWPAVVMLLVTALAACSRPNDPAAGAPVPPEAPPATSTAAPSSWEARLGQVVTLEGDAEDAKLGAVLIQGADMIWIDGLDAWPAGLRGKRVQVRGKVIQRADLPVFVHRDGEPEMAGMPVPPGTDLAKARRRFLLTEARWNLVQ